MAAGLINVHRMFALKNEIVKHLQTTGLNIDAKPSGNKL
jgi:hypothetical protein